jgi:hypothetical protein
LQQAAVLLVANVLSSAFGPFVASAQVSHPTTPTSDAPKLALVFEGKGTLLGWDLGVLKAVMERRPDFDDSQVVLAGNSSGSIHTAFFACHGLSPASFAEAEDLLLNFDRRLVNDSENVRKFMRIALGLETEYPHSNMDAVIARITDNGACVPRVPMVIAALNAEVLDNGVPRRLLLGDRMFRGQDVKRMDYRDYSVYLQGRYLGRACTYFVDRTMFDRLARMPADERLCELRLVENAADMKVAILASISEPTYFPQLSEPEPSKLYGTTPQLAARRRYGGGLVLPAVTQDLRRVFPSLHVLGTGRNYPAPLLVSFAQARYLVDVDYSMRLGKWWHDMEVEPGEQTWCAMVRGDFTTQQEYDLGYRQALYCFAYDICRPTGTIQPYFTTAACLENPGVLDACEPVQLRGGRGLSAVFQEN